MSYTCVLATSGRWRVVRHEGVMAFSIQSLGRDWTDEATVPAAALRGLIYGRALSIPLEDAHNLIAQLGPPLDFSETRRPAADFPVSCEPFAGARGRV